MKEKAFFIIFEELSLNQKKKKLFFEVERPIFFTKFNVLTPKSCYRNFIAIFCTTKVATDVDLGSSSVPGMETLIQWL